jgi:hypothetical protein
MTHSNGDGGANGNGPSAGGRDDLWASGPAFSDLWAGFSSSSSDGGAFGGGPGGSGANDSGGGSAGSGANGAGASGGGSGGGGGMHFADTTRSLDTPTNLNAAAAPAANAGAVQPDLDALALQVYTILKRRLAAERRRFG